MSGSLGVGVAEWRVARALQPGGWQDGDGRVQEEVLYNPHVVTMARRAYQVWQDEPGTPRLHLDDDALLELIPAASQFAQMLDLTTNCPIPASAADDDTPDYGLYLYLMLTTLSEGIAVLPQHYPDGAQDNWGFAKRERDFVVINGAELGLWQAVAVAQPRARVEGFIAQIITRHLA